MEKDKSSMPEWAQKLEEWGEKHSTKRDKRFEHKFGYVVTIGIMVLFLYLINNLSNWNISWLADNYTAALWVINLSFAATIVANIFYLFIDLNWFRALGQLILNIISLAVITTIYTTFPFTVNGDAAHLIKIFIIFVAICTCIGIIVELLKFIFYALRTFLK
jgi:hypothetical protein